MMKKGLLIIILALFFLSGYAQENEKTTYFLIRHAEKDRTNKEDKDPDLTEKGFQRANDWMEILGRFPLDAIYSTDYMRTQGTVKKLAFTQGIKVKLYHPFKIDFDNFLKETKGKSVVVVGHSNTIPFFVNKLIGKDIYQQLEDDDNTSLFIVTIDGENIAHVVINTKN